MRATQVQASPCQAGTAGQGGQQASAGSYGEGESRDAQHRLMAPAPWAAPGSAQGEARPPDSDLPAGICPGGSALPGLGGTRAGHETFTRGCLQPHAGAGAA